MDVIVNSTRTEMYLETAGSLSKAISKAAGPSLQAECRKEYPDGFALDDVAVTAGHALPCQNIYHVGLLPWDGGKGDSVKVTTLTNAVISLFVKVVTWCGGSFLRCIYAQGLYTSISKILNVLEQNREMHDRDNNQYSQCSNELIKSCRNHTGGF